MHVIVLVGRHRHRQPVAARQGPSRIFFFFDHRTPPSDREAFISRHVPLNEIDRTDAYSFDAPSDCSTAHRWDPITDRCGITAVRCTRCGHTHDLAEPYPGETNVERINTL